MLKLQLKKLLIYGLKRMIDPKKIEVEYARFVIVDVTSKKMNDNDTSEEMLKSYIEKKYNQEIVIVKTWFHNGHVGVHYLHADELEKFEKMQ